MMPAYSMYITGICHICVQNADFRNKSASIAIVKYLTTIDFETLKKKKKIFTHCTSTPC